MWLRFNGESLFRRAFVMSPKPWMEGGLPTATDDPLPRAVVYPFPVAAPDYVSAMLDLVRGVVML